MIVFYRRRIVRAVAGDLSAAQETRLRAHLRGCAACRSLYDSLALVAEAAAADAAVAGTTRAGAARAQLTIAMSCRRCHLAHRAHVLTYPLKYGSIVGGV